MARVSWNDVGQRFYEAGTDRGVLYLAGQDGVPWNGLLGVDENSSGGSPRPYYLDGYKYLNIAEADEYAATIKAYTSPREFDSCDGTAAIHNGLFATQQPRKNFGFSYRTLVGNDVDGLSLGYKIHLVYNALASPAQRSYATTSNSATPSTFDWGVTTVAPQLAGIRPTAHFVIDSRLTPPRLLEVIEGILYGTSSTAPRLPDVDELATLFKSLPPIAATNWIANGSFEYSNNTVLVRANLNLNPRLNNSIVGWGTTAAVATIAATTSGAQIDLTSAGASTPLFFQSANIAAAAGDRISSSMEITVPSGFPNISVQLRNYSYGTNVSVGESAFVTIEAGTTVTIVANSLIDVAADTTGVRSILYSNGVPLGARFFVKNALLEKSLVAGEYFDGSQPPKVRRNAATRPVASSGGGWFSNNNTIYTRSYVASGGVRAGAPSALFTRQNNTLNTFLASVYAVGQNSYGSEINGWTRVAPGETWTVSGGVLSNTPYRSRMSVAFFNAAGSAVGTSTDGEYTQDMPAGAAGRATQTIVVPAGARYMGVVQHVQSTIGNAVGGELTWMSDALIEKVSSLGEFFDSTTTPPTGYLIASEGTAGASPVYMYDGDFAVAWASTVDNSISNLNGQGIGIYSSPISVVRAIQSKHWAKTGTYSLRQIPAWKVRASGYTEFANSVSPRGMVRGQTYTMVIHFYQKVPKGFGTISGAYRAIQFIGPTTPESYFAQAADVSGEQEVRLTFTVPLTGLWYLRVYNGGMGGEESVWWDNAALFDGVYAGTAFNGDTPDTDIRIYDWVGIANQSESTLRSWYY